MVKFIMSILILVSSVSFTCASQFVFKTSEELRVLDKREFYIYRCLTERNYAIASVKYEYNSNIGTRLKEKYDLLREQTLRNNKELLRRRHLNLQ